jgi:hypothetical protein
MEVEAGWRILTEAWPVGTPVAGVVYAVQTFGAFVDLGTPFLGLMEYPDSDLAPGQSYEQGQTVRGVVRYMHPGLRQVLLRSADVPSETGPNATIEPPNKIRGPVWWPPRRAMVPNRLP